MKTVYSYAEPYFACQLSGIVGEDALVVEYYSFTF